MKLAFVCAAPDKRNRGMLSVDMSIRGFVERLGLGDVEVDLFVVAKGDGIVDVEFVGGDRIHYSVLWSPDEQFEEYDYVIYWGDFLHAYNYLEDLISLVSSGSDPAAVKDRVYKCLLCEGVSDRTKQKVLMLGGTLITNSATHLDPRYIKALASLYRNAVVVAPREPISVFSAAAYGGKHSSVIPGIDCAFFLDEFSLAGRSDESAAHFRLGQKIGYSFGRGIKSNRLTSLVAGRFLKKVSRATGIDRVENIDWLASDGLSEGESILEKIEQIRTCSFVVTDTYHCAITSWREGVPSLCLGLGTTKTRSTLNEKKKEILYHMFQAHEYYVYVEKLLMPLGVGREALRVKELLEDRGASSRVMDNIDISKDRYLSAVRDLIL